MSAGADPLRPWRRKLAGLAYRMLGSRADAEGVLQDAYLRFAAAERTEVRSTEAFLVTTVTRLCLDRLKSARAKREVYVGPWLPEPVADADALSPESALELADDLSFALMLTLDRLSPAERAAFLLHDIFDVPYGEVAATLGKSEAACRQLAARARKAVRGAREASRAKPEEHEALLQQFLAAAASGDTGNLRALLAEDAVAYADGGGVKIAALNPIVGADKITRFFTGLAEKFSASGRRIEFAPAEVNGAPGIIMSIDGAVDQTISIDVRDGLIGAIYLVRNPQKLGAFAPSPQ